MIQAIFYGANVTFLNKNLNLFLHSHINRYPLRYEDQRVSSEGQQVTGYPHHDVNNFFVIEGLNQTAYPHEKYIWTNEEESNNAQYVKNLDLVRIRHLMTNSYLFTHDVASPLTTSNMEISTMNYEDAQKRYNETVWRIRSTDISGASKLLTKRHHFRIESVRHQV